MPVIEIDQELKSVLLFSGAGILAAGLSVLAGRALFAGILGLALLFGLRKIAARIFGMDAGALMQFGVMPFLTFWFAAWVILVNV